VLHELIHAELYRKIISAGGQISPDNYLGIYDFYRRYKDWSHNQMAEFYRNTMIEGMKAYDIANGISFRPPGFYEAMSWAGLQGTYVWSLLDQAEGTYFLQIINDEANKPLWAESAIV
jgi:hypothetical protein